MSNSQKSAEIPGWQWIEERIRRVVQRYGYQEIRLPILASADLYALADLPQTDGSDERLILRPEGTLGCVRAVIDQPRTFRADSQRLWYQGPMFRQAEDGLTQFHQFGLEAFGMDGAEIDAELILLGWDIFSSLGLHRMVRLEINHLSAGDLPEPSSQCSAFCHLLDQAGIPYQHAPGPGRGHGYYSGTVFDWILSGGCEPRTVLASGGRYDALASRCAGRVLAATGFALDIERLQQWASPQQDSSTERRVHIALCARSQEAGLDAVMLSRDLRQKLPTLTVRCDLPGALPPKAHGSPDWVVTLLSQQRAEVWSRHDDCRRDIARDQVVDLIAGRVLLPGRVPASVENA